MRVRLLKVVVQPVFVADDGDTLTEQVAEPITVAAAGWQDFADSFAAKVDAFTQTEQPAK